MRGSKLRRHLRIGIRAGVFVFDPETNRSAKRSSLERSGQDLNTVCFFARGDDFRLARTAAVEVRLNISLAQFKLRRATVHHDPDSTAMGFAPCGDAEQ